MLILTYMNCGTIRKKVKDIPELEWADGLAVTMQLSLVTFIVGSQFISDASQSITYELVAIVIGLRGVVERHLAADKKPLFQAQTAGARKDLMGPRPAVPPRNSPVGPRPAVGFPKPAVAGRVAATGNIGCSAEAPSQVRFGWEMVTPCP